jgi:hypothetical protein
MYKQEKNKRQSLWNLRLINKKGVGNNSQRPVREEENRRKSDEGKVGPQEHTTS